MNAPYNPVLPAPPHHAVARAPHAGLRGVAGRIISELRAVLGPDLCVVEMVQRDWASVTFTGTRYCFRLRLPLPCGGGAMISRNVNALTEHQFTLVGVIVADCTGSIDAQTCDISGQSWLDVTVELLTICDK